MRKALIVLAVALAAILPASVAAGQEDEQQCDPNYDPCVPIAEDVDCLGGEGDGPEFVEGPVTVIGEDIYGLDGNDNDGIGCENGDDAVPPPEPPAPPVEEEPSFTG